MGRRSFTLLLVLAFAVAGVGVWLFGTLIVSGPSGVEDAKKVADVVASVPLQLVEDAAKPDEQTLDIKETPSILGIGNYPMIELGAMRYAKDQTKIQQAMQLLNGRSFKRWNGRADYDRKYGQMIGGYYTDLELFSSDGKKLVGVHYNPGFARADGGDGVYLQDGGVTYILEGDQKPVIDFLDRCTGEARVQTCLPDPQAARDSGSARTWLFEDEVPELSSNQESTSSSDAR